LDLTCSQSLLQQAPEQGLAAAKDVSPLRPTAGQPSSEGPQTPRSSRAAAEPTQPAALPHHRLPLLFLAPAPWQRCPPSPGTSGHSNLFRFGGSLSPTPCPDSCPWSTNPAHSSPSTHPAPPCGGAKTRRAGTPQHLGLTAISSHTSPLLRPMEGRQAQNQQHCWCELVSTPLPQLKPSGPQGSATSCEGLPWCPTAIHHRRRSHQPQHTSFSLNSGFLRSAPHAQSQAPEHCSAPRPRVAPEPCWRDPCGHDATHGLQSSIPNPEQ